LLQKTKELNEKREVFRAKGGGGGKVDHKGAYYELQTGERQTLEGKGLGEGGNTVIVSSQTKRRGLVKRCSEQRARGIASRSVEGTLYPGGNRNTKV